MVGCSCQTESLFCFAGDEWYGYFTLKRIPVPDDSPSIRLVSVDGDGYFFQR